MTKSHCFICIKRNNKIYKKNNEPTLPEHERCVCYLDWLRSVARGQATKLGINGADYYLVNFSKLPNYYITKEEATKLGWTAWLGNLDSVAPGKMIGGDLFLNREKKLPEAPGRVWYECDIDYNGGYRNNYRLIYSNDGLIFKTDSHYLRYISVE
ncbi:MAG: ribonuclease domain-containing protein [Clostridia bacterium]